MAANLFTPNDAQAPAANGNARGNFEKAIGFINLWLPAKNGGRSKLGAIPLKASDERHKALFDALNTTEDGKADIVKARILQLLDLDFQIVESGEGKHFDLGL